MEQVNQVIKPVNRAGLSFSIKRGRLLIYQATIRQLGNPEYIRFLLNLKGLRIAIQSCEPIDRDAIRVPKLMEHGKFQFEVSSSPLLSVIYKACRWEYDQTYLVFGRSYPRNHLVDYELASAVQISSEEFLDPEGMAGDYN